MNRRAKLDADIALSTADKSVTVQTNKETNKITHTQNEKEQTIYPRLAYRHVWITNRQTDKQTQKLQYFVSSYRYRQRSTKGQSMYGRTMLECNKLMDMTAVIYQCALNSRQCRLMKQK